VKDAGHAGIELALGIAVLVFPVALMVLAFGPWSERRVLAEAAAAEVARHVAVNLETAGAVALLERMAGRHGLEGSQVRLAWCGAIPVALGGNAGACPLSRGSEVSATVEVWAPLVSTPWGEVGGLWVRGQHSEWVDLYRSIP
jgi:hypothetical protein